ncbi:MAG TPA: adenosine deaminase, partial [Legionellaceae bacterium]|nr:adenosine deaminase [Legionellaceae bacterium]
MDNQPMQRFRFAVWLFLICCCTFSHASVQEYFQSLRAHPDKLYDFLKAMPKGGDLHYHYDGAVYAETMLHLGSKTKHLCIQPHSLDSKLCSMNHTDLPIKNALNQPSIYHKIIRAWSMQDFKSSKHTAHDHFFSVFPKVAAFYSDLKAQLLAEILKKAAAQNTLYLEIIAFGFPAGDDYAKLIQSEPDFAKKRAILIANPSFLNNVEAIVKESNTFLTKAHSVLHCDTHPEQPACQIKVNFQFYVRRVKS